MVFNSELVTDDLRIAEGFNNYFSTIGAELDSNLPAQINSPNLEPHRENTPSFYLFPIDRIECSKIIKGLKNTRGDLDTIPVRIFRSISHVIIEPLMRIINYVFSQGVFPYQLKIARVTPI